MKKGRQTVDQNELKLTDDIISAEHVTEITFRNSSKPNI